MTVFSDQILLNEENFSQDARHYYTTSAAQVQLWQHLIGKWAWHQNIRLAKAWGRDSAGGDACPVHTATTESSRRAKSSPLFSTVSQLHPLPLSYDTGSLICDLSNCVVNPNMESREVVRSLLRPESSAITEYSGIKRRAEGQQGSLGRSKLAKPTKYIVTREIMDYHNDPYGGPHDTTVVGKFLLEGESQ